MGGEGVSNLVDTERIAPETAEGIVEAYERGEYESIRIRDLVAFRNAERVGTTASVEILNRIGSHCPERGADVADLFDATDPDVRAGAISLWSAGQEAFPAETRERALRAAARQLLERDDPNTNEEVYRVIENEIDDGVVSREAHSEVVAGLLAATDPAESPYAAGWGGASGVETLWKVLEARTPDDADAVVAHLEALLAGYDESDYRIRGENVQPDQPSVELRAYAALGLISMNAGAARAEEVLPALRRALEDDVLSYSGSVAACEGLGTIYERAESDSGTDAAAETLRRLAAEHRSDGVRAAAESALAGAQ